MNNKGFTLVEVLVVILIIGILAVIMVPSVSSVIKDSERKTLKSSVVNIERIVTQRCSEEKMDGKEITKTYTITDGKITGDLDIKLLPNSGEVYVTDDCVVTVSIVDGEYCAVKRGSAISINTNIYHCGVENLDIPETEVDCFVFDTDTHTITGYDFDNEKCPTAISIPTKIDDVLVEHISDMAFVRGDNKILLASSYNEAESNSLFDNNEGYYDIYENASREGRKITSTLILHDISESITKDCYYDNYKSVDKRPLDYIISDNDIYDECRINVANLSSEEKVVLEQGSITSVDFSKAYNLESIGANAFYNNKIKTLTFGSLPTLKTIGANAFFNNVITGELDLSGLRNLRTIPVSAFANNDIFELSLPSKLTTIEAGAFAVNNIDYITLPTGLKRIGDDAFYYNRITGLKIPDTIEYISGFRNNYIGEIVIPSSVNTIGIGAFGSNRLRKLSIPSNVEIIGDDAFMENNIVKLVFNEGLKEIRDWAFAINSIDSIDLPSSLQELYPAAFTINNVPEEQYFVYSIKNGIEDRTTLISYAGPRGSSVINVPSGVKVIERNALWNVLSKTINIPSSVTTIKSYGLSTTLYRNCIVNIASGITVIEPNAFYCDDSYYCYYRVNINRKKNAISGSPWGNSYGVIRWLGIK